MSYGTKPQPAPPPPPAPPVYTPMWMIVFGWLISILPALALLASGIAKIVMDPEVMKQPGAPDIGWKNEAILGLAILEIVGAVLYLLPYSAVLGAIILTAYIGGAIATHVRIGDAFAVQLLLGIMLWVGLVFRDARLRNMLPVRSVSSQPAGPSGCLSFIGIIFLSFTILIGLLLGIANSLTDNYVISRSIIIDAPPSKVFPHVSDFSKWKPWNPFEKPDPDIQVTITPAGDSPIGSTYKWKSEKVGVGAMKITDFRPDEFLKIHIEFEEPVKSSGDAVFKFKEVGNERTELSWTMDGESPYMFKVIRSFPMAMDLMVGTKFEAGLADLKKVVESEREPAQK